MVNATDNCDDDVEITFSEEFIGDAPEPGADLVCDLLAPDISGETCVADGAPAWSMVLPGFLTEFGFPEDYLRYYTIVPGTGSFTEFDDGSVQIVAIVQSVDIPTGRWEITLNLEPGYSWDQWQALPFDNFYKDDCGFVTPANLLNEDWTYYLFNNSVPNTLVGLGDFAGSFLTLEQAPDNLYFGYQLGDGANNVSPNFGSGGWFFFEGNFVDGSSGASYPIDRNLGDFAFEHDCCPDYGVIREWCATDCKGNETCIEQTIVYENFTPGISPLISDPGYRGGNEFENLSQPE